MLWLSLGAWKGREAELGAGKGWEAGAGASAGAAACRM